jgi:hypothetical protein
MVNGWLVGGLEHEFYFPFHIWDVILPIDEVIFFRGVGQPPTSVDSYKTMVNDIIGYTPVSLLFFF